MNLTAVRDPGDAWQKLILESLRLLDAHAFAGSERVVDVGSGAGIPGIPLRLALPGLSLTLVESDQRKAAFLREALAELGLGDVDVEARRAEEVGRDPRHREAYDVAVTRAAAKAAVAAEYCLPLLRHGGWLLAQARLRDWEEARRAVATVGGRLAGYREGTVLVRKARETPDAYPRRTGVPARRPL